MTSLRSVFLFFLCLCSALSLRAALEPTSAILSEVSEANRPIVLTTIAPYRYLLSRIAGDLVKIETIVPVGANAHLFEPTPKDMKQWEKAALWLRNSDALEKKIFPILKEQNPTLTAIDLWKDLPLLCSQCKQSSRHSHATTMDTHIWLSPKMAALQAEKIARALKGLLPEHSGLLNARLAVLLKELEELDQELTVQLSPLKGKAFLISHPSFSYFCRDYGLRQLSIETEGKEPLLKEIETLLQQAKDEHVCAVFSMPQFSDKGARLLAQKLQVPLYSIDPYGENYLQNLRQFAQLLAQ